VVALFVGKNLHPTTTAPPRSSMSLTAARPSLRPFADHIDGSRARNRRGVSAANPAWILSARIAHTLWRIVEVASARF
jgi:hypothetical protein